MVGILTSWVVQVIYYGRVTITTWAQTEPWRTVELIGDGVSLLVILVASVISIRRR